MIHLPEKPKITQHGPARAVLEIEGLYPGYGHTLGNALRRVLLSSLPGAAITSVKIEGIGHEFSTIEGVMEDIVDIILNLKQMRFRMHGEGPFTVTLSASGEKEVTGKDFKTPSQVEVISSDLHIATLTAKKAHLSLEAVVESGLGYVPVEARNKEKMEVGTIALDAAFSPVRSVNYEVENMRVEDRTDYNRLKLTIETDGSVTPSEAFTRAAEILAGQFRAFEEGFAESVSASEHEEARGVSPVSASVPASGEEESVMKVKLDELKLSSRTLNALREAGIKTVGGLARKRQETIAEIEGMGEKGIQEIKKALGNFGITLKQ
ncbi:MAG: DNA-directed RNA polymerase subunit alpha [Candidatus Sungbacteria bacterium]|uniref:DNA-directed RNA polymerase subunit alpha n=1 Tax=Candidatus Sungiibacteriota bacterium TaxID=2750080 RepID=A0A932VS93_9BACT|nr:DNA-directed RNA polymerase subunit alpha [Candidatus Sungbacteria bacterium]